MGMFGTFGKKVLGAARGAVRGARAGFKGVQPIKPGNPLSKYLGNKTLMRKPFHRPSAPMPYSGRGSSGIKAPRFK